MGRKQPYNYQVAIEHLVAHDAPLGRVIEAIGPCGLGLEQRPIASTFEALLEAITHQQLSTKAAATIYSRVCDLAPDLEPAHFQSLDSAVLRGAGLSGAKVLAVQDLALRCTEGTVPSMAALHDMEDAQVIESLTRVRGIGRWSAEMLLIFRLGRLDVLPFNDLSIQKGFQNSFRKSSLPLLEAMARRGERWRPYRSVASWYLWRAAEL